MKILHCFDHSIPLHSGYTFRSRSIIREQRKLGWETCHLTSLKHNLGVLEKAESTDALPKIEEVDGLEFYRCNDAFPFLSSVPMANQLYVVQAMKKRLLEVAQLEKPDLIHAHSPALNGLAALSVGKKLGIPVCYEIRAFWEDAAVDHGTTKEGDWRYQLTRKMESRVVREADAVFTICEGLRRDIIERGTPEDKITVIPNAVDIEKFSVIEKKSQTLLDKLNLNGKFVIGFIGSFYAYEGLPLILEAAKVLREKIPELHVLMVGGGPEEAALKQLCQEHQLDSIVTFTGRVPHAEVNDYYSLIDVLCYPRIRMRLTDLVTPLKPLEAMAQKSLFVASDVGGHKELVQHDHTGLLFKDGDVQAMAEQVLRIRNEESLRERLKAEGRVFVEQQRNWAKSISNYVKVYQRLVGCGRFVKEVKG